MMMSSHALASGLHHQTLFLVRGLGLDTRLLPPPSHCTYDCVFESSFLLQPQQATPSPVATPKLPSLPDHPAINASDGGNEKPNVGDHHGSDMGEAEEEEGADQRPEQGNKDDAGDEGRVRVDGGL